MPMDLSRRTVRRCSVFPPRSPRQSEKPSGAEKEADDGDKVDHDHISHEIRREKSVAAISNRRHGCPCRERRPSCAAVRGKDTRPEMILRQKPHARGFRYRLHDRRLPARPVFHRAVGFVHGCFLHRHPTDRYARLRWRPGQISGRSSFTPTGCAIRGTAARFLTPAGELRPSGNANMVARSGSPRSMAVRSRPGWGDGHQPCL